jgi:hypothetical protein
MSWKNVHGREARDQESHSNPVVNNFEYGPLAVLVAFGERSELKEVHLYFAAQNVTVWWLALQSHVQEVPASNFIVPSDDGPLEHLFICVLCCCCRSLKY